MQAVTPLNIEAPTKSSGNADQGLTKKLKGLDSLAMSIGNGIAESAEGGVERRPSQRFVYIYIHIRIVVSSLSSINANLMTI